MKIPEKSLADDSTLQQKRYNPDLLPLCACGCGQQVKGYRSKYLRNHCDKLEKLDWDNLSLCLCGCGEKVKHPKSKYLNGHWLKKLKKDKRIDEFVCRDTFKRMSNETYMEACRIRSERMMGNEIWKLSSGFTGKTHSDHYKERCKDHPAEYGISGIAHENSGIGKTGLRKIGEKEIWFRSTWEANFARYLYYKELDFIFEPRTFRVNINERETTYLIDFYIESKDTYYEVKGYVTPESIDRLTQVKQQGFKIYMIGPRWYRKIENKYKDLIIGWEKS